MSNLIISVRKLQEDKDFRLAEKDTESGFKQMLSCSSVMDAWQKRQDYVKPGQAIDGTKALELTLRLSGGDESSENTELFGSTVYKTCCALFKKENILSCFVKGGTNPIVVTTIFPLVGRKLNPDQWIDSRAKDKVNHTVKAFFETELKKHFSSLMTENDKVGKTQEEEGYLKPLIDFVPHEEQKENDAELFWDTPELDSQIQSDMPFDQMKKLTQETLIYFTAGPEKTLYERALRNDGDITQKDFQEAVLKYLCRDHAEVSQHDKIIICNKIMCAVFQYYILEPLLNDDKISDIKVLAPDRIRVKVGGERYTSNFKFLNANDYYRFINGLLTRYNRSFMNSAIQVISDTDVNPNCRLRINITSPLINSVPWPYLHIRKIPKKKRGMDYLLNAKMLDQKMADYLIDRARYGKGMIFCGKGASGKTTLMNCLLDYIPFDKSGLIIQESDELFSDVHPDIMFQHIKTDCNPPYDLQAEAQNGLLTDLDYFIIGEVKGAEAKYFINAADTGHRCWCSVHAPSSLDAIDKLADYVMYETKYDKREAEYMLKDLGTVIFMKNFKVCEISELDGWDNTSQHIKYKQIYKRPEF